MKGILPCVGCVGIVEAKLDRSCAGIHSSVVELASLTSFPFHCLNSMINPTVDWLGLNLGEYLAMCELVVPFFLVEIMPNSGVEVVLRYLWAQLAYGWVELCSDIASF